MVIKKNFYILTIFLTLLLSSCSRMGYGILLWSVEEPQVLSGTVLAVYARSNINQVWIVGVPGYYRRLLQSNNMIEVPLSQFEFVGNRRRAVRRSEDFFQYARIYAENLQDGLPIRDRPDNGARRVYRLRAGEIIKILERVDGNIPISATGAPLPGYWYRVLTESGVIGFCFSFRLRMFEHTEGAIAAGMVTRTDAEPDPDLDLVLSRTWSPEFYQQMISQRRINISDFERRFRFDPGHDTGIARIIHPDVQMDFIYDEIVREGERQWRFEGTSLTMNLRTNTTLAVQFSEGTGLRRTLLFAALPQDVDDIIFQENARREAQFMSIYNHGPVFTSNNFGTITFTRTGGFTWTGFDLLVPQHLPHNTIGEGSVHMDLFVAQSFLDRYDGAFTFRFSGANSPVLRFMYYIDNQGMRLEVVPDFGVENVTVTRRATSPMILYFFRDSPF